MKVCKKCGAEKPKTEFNKHPTTRDRLQQNCKPCHREQSRVIAAANPDRIREGNKRNYYKDPAARIAYSKAWYENNKERSNASARVRYSKNPRPRLDATKRWALRNPEKNKERQIAFGKANPWRLTQYTAKKRAEKLAMPSWANRFFINEVYELAALRTKALGAKYTVDHVVPLHGKTVCGLHVENNLSVILHADNAKKGNRYWPEMPRDDDESRRKYG